MPNFNDPLNLNYKNRQLNTNVAKEIWRVNTGTVPGDMTGDNLHAGGNKINTALTELVTAVNQLNANDDTLKSQLETLIQEVNSNITTIINTHSTSITTINNTISTIENLLSNASGDITDILVALDNLQAHVTALLNTKANIISPQFLGSPKITDPIPDSANENEIVTAFWVRKLIHNLGLVDSSSSTPPPPSLPPLIINPLNLRSSLEKYKMGLDFSYLNDTSLQLSEGGCFVFNNALDNDKFIVSSTKTFSLTSPFNPDNLNVSFGGIVRAEDLPLGTGDTLHIFALKGTAGQTIWAAKSISAAPPTGYAFKRRLASIKLGTGGSIIPFRQFNNYFQFTTRIRALNGYAVSTTGELITMPVPVGIRVQVNGTLSVGSPQIAANTWRSVVILVLDGDLTGSVTDALTFQSNFDGTNSANTYYYNSSNAYSNDAGTSEVQRITNTSGQLYFRRVGSYYSAGYQTTYQVHGYTDISL